MDWGRAKNVLIYAFLLLNLVLGYQLWTDVREQADTNLDFASLSESTQKVMKGKSIQLLCQIPSITPQLPKITYQYLNGESIGPQIGLQDKIESQLIFRDKDLVSALKGPIPEIGNYQYDPQAGEYTSKSETERVNQAEAAGRFVMHALVDHKWPLFNDQMELYYSEQRIIAYRYSPVEIVASGAGDKEHQKMMPASNALKTLVERHIPPGSAIKDIQLGYYGQVYNSESQVAAPSWRFTLENGEMYYVQGISGDVTVTSPKTEKEKE
ncbi:two-component system regulatory protein YycI [Paenibacillus sp.]|jgi:regulatory protein YycI of two-component signal transduction system YycFG|uniref:two-component system regulatory protein YycI n=1 Tax=Paenibacillus sp. TaxID=58172 RepID=UPI00281B89F2|nr:two-component system regulatory protein YycI [Paenibacillus sp.]MDR0267847.1 two-component system regulatory protein YycI [Paenibacillus sp.]